MKFSSIPRRGYVQQPTPLQKLPRFSEALGGAELWIKRDDLLPFGGNKLRKMDYLMEQAVQMGADTVITASTNQCCHNGILLLLGNREAGLLVYGLFVLACLVAGGVLLILEGMSHGFRLADGPLSGAPGRVIWGNAGMTLALILCLVQFLIVFFTP